MTQSKHTKRALLTSVLAMLVCVALLIGSTFAWFTDSVTSGRNRIVAGNLDVELEYWDGTSWQTVTENTNLFKPTEGANATLWEPGHTEYVQLRIRTRGRWRLHTISLSACTAMRTAAKKKSIPIWTAANSSCPII